LYAIALPTELKEISTTAVGRGGYEPTTVPITLGRKRSRYTTITKQKQLIYFSFEAIVLFLDYFGNAQTYCSS
jgi:hypothetical protein